MPDKKPQSRKILTPLLIWLLVFVAAWAAWNFFSGRRSSRTGVDYSDFVRELTNDVRPLDLDQVLDDRLCG